MRIGLEDRTSFLRCPFDNLGMEIYLDANATTRTLPQACNAAVAVMNQTFGNPSSVHVAGLRARSLLDETRAIAREVLEVEAGDVLFTSGATEGIQTAVVSALRALCKMREAGNQLHLQLLYGATEHKAVPEALHHWNAVLGLNLSVLPIPVDRDGRHDLAWLKVQAPSAGLVCTMAANNETGVISDLDGIAAALVESPALWLVDCVQGLGKMPLRLSQRKIDYASFSGHKVYAPKGIGMLYVREGAPFTPLLIGGGQESSFRAGTENMAGIAALGAVLYALRDGTTFVGQATLERYRADLKAALTDAFPGLAFNASEALSLPTTVNFSVPGVSSRLIQDLFDAAGLRVSGGSACSASKTVPSYVLKAMDVPAWQAENAVRLSFGAADTAETIAEACLRIRHCGASMNAECMSTAPQSMDSAVDLVTRFVVEGACCYLVADASSRRCIIIDPLPALGDRLAQWIRCRRFTVAAVLDTHSHGDHESSARELRSALASFLDALAPEDTLGWPVDAAKIGLGKHSLKRISIPGHTLDSTAYLLLERDEIRFAFVGDTVMCGALGRSDFEQSAPLAFATSLRTLEEAIGRDVILLPSHDYDDRFGTTLSVECRQQPLLAAALEGRIDDSEFAEVKAELERDIHPTAYNTMACGARVGKCSEAENVEISSAEFSALLEDDPATMLVDVREIYEQAVSDDLELPRDARALSVPLTTLVNALPYWSRLSEKSPLVFLCRSGNRSMQAARALRRLGRINTWSLRGGIALLNRAETRESRTEQRQAIA